MTTRERTGGWAQARRWLAARSLWLGVAAAVLTAGSGPLISLTGGGSRIVLIALGVLAAVLAFAIPAARARESEIAVEDERARVLDAQVEMRVALADALVPVFASAVTSCDPATGAPDEETVGTTVGLVLATAVKLCETNDLRRVRACWYRLDTDRNGVRRLLPSSHFGRGATPTVTFAETEPRGAALLRLLASEKTELWPDLDDQTPEDWKKSGRATYKTFLRFRCAPTGRSG